MEYASKRQVTRLHKEVKELHTLMAKVLVKLELNTNTPINEPSMGELIVTLAKNQMAIYEELSMIRNTPQ